MDYVISIPIYTYPSTIYLMYYYSKVLLLQNYFYHEKSEMLWKKSEKGTSELRSTRPNLVLVLATRCLYWGCTSELRSTRPNSLPVLATRCLYQGYISLQVSLTQQLSKCQADLQCLYGGYV